MSETELDRRTFIKAGAGATAAAAAGGATLHSPRLSPVGQSEAIPVIPLAVGTAAAVGSTWLLEEVDIFGSDEPPDGLTDDLLKEEMLRTCRQRYSYEQSMFVDQLNLIEGAEHVGYDAGKRAAWDAINDGDSQGDVTDAAQSAINDYFTDLFKNFLKSWNEGVAEASAMWDLEDEAGFDEMLVTPDQPSDHPYWRTARYELDGASYELPDGSTFDVHELDTTTPMHPIDGGDGHRFLAFNPQDDYDHSAGNDDWEAVEENRNTIGATDDDGVVLYQSTVEWNYVLEKLENAYDEAHDGITLWVDGVYGDVQEGDLDPADLVSPRDIAGMLDEDEDLARAKADLLALNIDTDLNREAKIETTLDGYGYEVVVSGMFAATSAPSDGFETGETYTPNSGGVGSVHMAAHSSALAIEVPESHYDEDLDGGVMTWDRTAAEGYEYYVQTNNGETATITEDDLDPVQDDWYYGVENWEVDLSDQLDQPITQVETVTGAAAEEQSVNLQIANEFEILEITDGDGDPVDTLDPMPPTESHSDDNYLTPEDYEAMNDDLMDAINAIEDALDDSGGISGGGAGFIDDLTDFGASTIQTIVGGLILFILFIFGLNAASS